MLAGIAFLLFCTFLPSLGIDHKYWWVNSGLLAFCGCVLASRLPRPWILPGMMLWFAGLGTITLLARWQSGSSDGFTLAGLFPYSDAAGYFSDAQRILAGDPISSFSSRRPLYAAFLAGVLKVAGNNLRMGLWLQTMLISCTIGCLASGFLRRTGRILATAVFGMTLWTFFHRFIGTTTTESLGFLLGVLGFFAIWESLHDRSIRLFALGLVLTGLALNVRAGAFFILPTLVLWGGLHFAKIGQRLSWQALTIGSCALVASFGFNYGVLLLSGGHPALAFSNFSYTLYGLVYGGNWQLALAQHPELRSLEPGTQAASVLHLALGQIQAHPLALVWGALKAWGSYFPRAFLFVGAPAPWSPISFIGRLFFTLLALRGLIAMWQTRSSASSRLMFACLAGIFLSVPFAPPWDSDYMRIFAATIPVLCWLASMGAESAAGLKAVVQPLGSSTMFKGILLVGAGLLLTLGLPHFRSTAQDPALLRSIPGSSLHINSRQPATAAPPIGSRPRNTWAARSGEWCFPPISLDQLSKNAPPGIAPEGIHTFLNRLPQENVTLALATGKAWPASSSHGTNLIVVQGSSAWAFDASGPLFLGAIPPPSVP